jgi:hypothetical protein
VDVHWRLLSWTLDHGGGRPGVHVECEEVTVLTLYHPLGTLRWWRPSFAAGCGETRSLSDQPVSGCSTLPSPSWGHPSSL